MAGGLGAPLLVCRGLRKRFGERVAVDGLDLAVAAGETYGLLGPNGAGKTTAISMVCGILQRDDGTVEIGGRSLDDDPSGVKAAIGYVPQDLAVYPDLSATENLTFFGRLYGLRGAALRQRVAEVLEIVGLADRGRDRVETFSGGMKRRLNIAAGLLHRPSLLILDEPTVGVDPQSRHAILENVRELGASGMAVLYTTHYMEEAQRLCDRIGILDDGRLVAEGTHDELVARVGERDHVRLTVQGRADALAAACRDLDGVHEASVLDGGVVLVVDRGRELVPRLFPVAARVGAAVSSVAVDEPDLEAVFLHLTGKALRDQE